MIKLLALLLEALKEEIRKKPLLSKGGHKQVYVATNYKSKDLPGSDFVVKKWKDNETVNGIVRREYDIYSKNKSMFAPIVKIDFERNYMIQKRLDTTRAQNEIQQLKKYLSPFYDNHEEFVYRDLPEYFEVLAEDPDKAEEVRATIKNQKALELYDRWVQFTIDMFKMDRKFKDRLGKDRDLIVDFHDGNIGYDTDGKIKFIDI